MERALDPRSKLPRQLFLAFIVVDLAWMAGHFAVFNAGRTALHATFGLGYETNPPTWWSAALLGIAAGLCFVLASRPWTRHPLVSECAPSASA